MVGRTPPTWFVTGASSGIGLALAQAAATRGDNVVAASRDLKTLDSLTDEHEGRVLAVSTDVRRQAEVDAALSRAVETFGRIDIVANNAGYGLSERSEEVTDEQARAPAFLRPQRRDRRRVRRPRAHPSKLTGRGCNESDRAWSTSTKASSPFPA